jgi:hypothetical protein
MKQEPILAYAQVNARIMPIDRGERYEEPLAEALAETGWGEVGGGATMTSENGEIEYCGVDVDLFDVTRGVPFVCDFLAKRGAPKGSKLQYEHNGETIEVPFGTREGLAIYLNGTDLLAEVYEQCDINDLYAELNRLLGDRGEIQGHWQGPTETALYLYGFSAAEMRGLIADHMAAYPLCQRARFETIA